MLFSLICLNTLSVSAEQTSVWSYEYDVDIYGQMGMNGSELAYPIEYEEVNGTEYCYYYRLMNIDYLYPCSENSYAYKVLLVSRMGNEMNANSMVMWARPVIGSYSDLLQGNWEMGNSAVLASAELTMDISSSWMWYETNGTDEPMYIGILFRCRSYKTSSGSESSPFVDFSGSIGVSVIEYTEEDYTAEINSSLEEQNRISSEQLVQAQQQTQIQEDMKTELEEQTQIQEDMKTELEEQTDTQKGILEKITTFFSGFFDNFKNMVVGIFVPSLDELAQIWEKYEHFFERKFGFLWQAFDYSVDLINVCLSESDDTAIRLPSFSINGYKIWNEFVFDFKNYPVIDSMFRYARLFTSFLICTNFVRALKNFYDKRFGGGGT